ncbi:MAG: mechanosensitive ion channel family protein [Bacteroidetes bacterium]|nr:MAG: mechanosensitive ion channel family protein [Bacteroidota bacterium]
MIQAPLPYGLMRDFSLNLRAGVHRRIGLLVILGLFLGGCSWFTGEDDGTSVLSENDSLESASLRPTLGQGMARYMDSLSIATTRLDTVSISGDDMVAESFDDLADAISYLGSTISAYTQEQARASGTLQASKRAPGRIAQGYGLRVFFALVVLAFNWFIVRGVTFVLEKLSERNAEHRLFFKRLVPIARVLIWTTAGYFILRTIFEVNTQNLFAAAAAVGVAIGFAAQGVVRNIFGGFVIISDRPFQIGDKICVEGTYGEVLSIGLQSTRIVTPDDSVVTVPNAQMVDSQVSNANSGELNCQVVTDLYLPGHVDESVAKQIAYEAAASSKYVYLKKPIVVLVLDEFRETFVTHLKVKAYVLDTRYEFLLVSDITERARKAFREAGLLDTLHGARAYVDLSGLGETTRSAEDGKR